MLLPGTRALLSRPAPHEHLRKGKLFFATYAQDPLKWQVDPAVMMYGQLLKVRDTQPDAFLVAAETLRAQKNLPRDLRASATRARATVHFQKAAAAFEALSIAPDAPWPGPAFVEALAAATTACNAYEAAVAESADPELCIEVLPHVPQWPEVVRAAQTAHLEVRKLRAELRFKQINWHTKQAEHARAVAEAKREGSSGGLAGRAATALEAADLAGSEAEQERELWTLTAAACEELVAECAPGEEDLKEEEKGSEAGIATTAALQALQARGLALQALTLKDLAVACAMDKDLEVSVGHMLRALQLRPRNTAALTGAGAEQIRVAAKGVLELCGRQMQTASEQVMGETAALWAAKLSEAISGFDGWRKEQ